MSSASSLSASRSAVTAQALPPFARPAPAVRQQDGARWNLEPPWTEAYRVRTGSRYSVEEVNPFRLIGAGCQVTPIEGCDGASGVHSATAARWGDADQPIGPSPADVDGAALGEVARQPAQTAPSCSLDRFAWGHVWGQVASWRRSAKPRTRLLERETPMGRGGLEPPPHGL
jgi:hypothetical protein